MKSLEERALSLPHFTFYVLRFTVSWSDARTPHGNGRVLARRGRAGEKDGFFSILLDDSAFTDVVGDIAGGIGEANHRFRANIGNHAGKSFPALLVE